jgi:phosphatidylglycerophosphatase C
VNPDENLDDRTGGPPLRPVTSVAAFDLDGTLTTRDCVVPFLRRVAGTGTLVTRMLGHPVGLAGAGLRRDRDALKRASVAGAFTGQHADEVQRIADVYAEEVHATWLRRDVVAELERHRDRGDTVVVVSASFEVYVRPLAALLGAQDVLATRLEVDESGRLSGRLVGANCRGPEKVRRLHGWLDEHAAGRSSVMVTAYGDSAGDRELLSDADVAHWVGRGRMPR